MTKGVVRFALASIAGLLLLLGPAPGARAGSPAGGLEGTWVGGYEAAGTWQPVLVVLNPSGTGLLQPLGAGSGEDARTRRSLALLGRERDRVQLAAEADGDRWVLDGALSGDRLSGVIMRGHSPGMFVLFPVKEMSTRDYDRYIGAYRAPPVRDLLVTRGDEISQAFYLEGRQQVRLYPLGDGRFFSLTGEILTFESSNGRAGVTLSLRTVRPMRDDTEVTAAPAALYREEEVAFESEGVTLHGSVLLPGNVSAAAGPGPGVVVLHGAGAAERHYYRIYGYQLAQAGLAVLLYDRRGAGESGGAREEDVALLAADARAALEVLRRRAAVDPTRVGLLGFSHGGRVAPMAAAGNDDLAFVVGVSAPGMPVEALEAWALARDLEEAGAPAWLERAAGRAHTFSAGWTRLWNPAGVSGGFTDPRTAWAEVHQPVLLLYGAEDRVIPPVASAAEIAAALESGGNAALTIRIHPSADHDLLAASGGLPTYPAGFFEGLAAWMHALDGPPGGEVLELERDPQFLPGGSFGRPPWYGRVWPQLAVLFFCAGAFLWGLGRWVLPPEGAGQPALGGRLPHLSGALSALGLVEMAGFGLLLWDTALLQAYEVRSEFSHAVLVPGLPVLAAAFAALATIFLVGVLWALRAGRGRVRTWPLALAAALFVGELMYWGLLGG